MRVYGWDLSTSVVGYSEFTYDSGSLYYVRSGRIETGKVEERDVVSIALGCKSVLSGLGLSGTVSFVEDRLAGFSGGSHARTIMKLAEFSAVFRFMLVDTYGVSRIEAIHPSTVKSRMRSEGLLIQKGADKKELTLEFVRHREPLFPYELGRTGRPKPYCYDMADSYIVGLAGVRMFLDGVTGKKDIPAERGARTRGVREG